MSTDLKQQLAVLRRRVTMIQNRPRPRLAPIHYDADALMDGKVVENQHGRYFLWERFFPGHRRHGNVEISRLAELPGELLTGVSNGEIEPCEARRWAFLDTETTGLAGGTGTCAFLVGVGAIEDGGLRIRLFFMRDYDEEAAMLAGLTEFLAGFQVLVSYNGKAYDAPLLDTRYRLARLANPLERLAHLDLLFAARRLWRLRMDSCRLVELENQVLGLEREGDLPGEMIPYYYFEYLRTRQAFRLVPLFHHNMMDIATLAALTAVVLPVFAAPSESGLRHGEDLLGLARWLRQNGGAKEALALYRRAVEQGLRDEHLFRALWETAQTEKKLGRTDRALEIWRELAAARNPFRVAALEELAKYYEHTQRDYRAALEMTTTALSLDAAPELEHRRERLQRKSSAESQALL